MYVCMYACIMYVCMCACTHCMYVGTDILMDVCILYVCMYVYVYIRMYDVCM